MKISQSGIDLIKLIRDKVEHPATPRELLQRLKIPREERPTLKRLLKDLVSQGALVETRGNRYGLPDRMNLIVGRITAHPRGFGFVVPDRPVDGVSGDIYVAGSNLNQAMHGDRVVARVERVLKRASCPSPRMSNRSMGVLRWGKNQSKQICSQTSPFLLRT